MMSMQNNSMMSRDDAYLPRDPLSRDRLSFHTVGESKTRQSEKDAANVNNIVQRFQRTGFLPPARRQPQYVDVTALQQGDLTEKVSKSRAVQEQYVEEIRKPRRKKKEEQQPLPLEPDASKSAAKAPSGGGEPTPS